MTTKDDDTDPSTPSARRPSKGRFSTVAPRPPDSPPPPAVDTDPGLAPPPQKQLTPPTALLGIRVPAPSSRPPPPAPAQLEPPTAADDVTSPDGGVAVVRAIGPEGTATAATGEDAARLARKKDSVELLLDGMAELRLDRPRTTPQTDGQASASYHAEHAVRASERPPPEDEPKVLFERPSTPLSLRLASAAGAAPREGAVEPTVVSPAHTLRRVLLALCAGIAVVIAIFVVLQRGTQSAPPPPPPPPPQVAAPVVRAAPPPAPIATVVTAPVMALPPAPSAPAESSAPAVAPVSVSDTRPTEAPAAPRHTQMPRSRPRPVGAPPSGDLGEFKTTY